ncbi:unnamed protein product [Rangifer tarandus platyrhynchus]|uniref:Uncharacterized protein n=1 Tax=Rangifer tarandus platyrhynchus TaxID=3082113 RepID=A0AC60A019_RANTA
MEPSDIFQNGYFLSPPAGSMNQFSSDICCENVVELLEPEGFFNLSGVEKRARGPQKGKDHGPQANAGRPEARDWLLGPLQLTRVFRLTSAAEDSLEAEAKKKCLECSGV